MVELKPDIDPNTLQTFDESWTEAHEKYEALRRQLAKPQTGGATPKNTKKK